MKKLLLFLPLFTPVTACQSKTDVCARWDAGQISNSQAASWLGVNLEKDVRSPRVVLSYFCAYYKN